jgi:hypothetical protein
VIDEPCIGSCIRESIRAVLQDVVDIESTTFLASVVVIKLLTFG